MTGVRSGFQFSYIEVQEKEKNQQNTTYSCTYFPVLAPRSFAIQSLTYSKAKIQNYDTPNRTQVVINISNTHAYVRIS